MLKHFHNGSVPSLMLSARSFQAFCFRQKHYADSSVSSEWTVNYPQYRLTGPCLPGAQGIVPILNFMWIPNQPDGRTYYPSSVGRFRSTRRKSKEACLYFSTVKPEQVLILAPYDVLPRALMHPPHRCVGRASTLRLCLNHSRIVALP